jgi:hypothetical protein
MLQLIASIYTGINRKNNEAIPQSEGPNWCFIYRLHTVIVIQLHGPELDWPWQRPRPFSKWPWRY